MKDVSAALEELDGLGWEDTTEDSGFGELPDDTYQVSIEAADINRAKSSGRLQVSFSFNVESGQYIGRKIFKHSGLDTEDNRGRFRGELARLGVPWPKASDLPQVLQDEVVGSFCEVKLKENKTGDGQWCNFVKAIDEADIDNGTAPAAAATAPVRTTRNAPVQQEAAAQDPVDDGGAEEPAEAAVDLSFDDKAINNQVSARISKLAKQLDFTEGEYQTKTDLIADMAEHVGISGTFKDPLKLVSMVEKQAATA